MTSSVLSVEVVNVEYDRMKDCPAEASNLTRRPVIGIRGTVPLNDFLSTETMFTVPGLRSIFICSEAFTERMKGNRLLPATVLGTPGIWNPGVMPAELMDSMSSARIPQPIWYPASNVPPVSFVPPPPVIEPVNVPSTRYSRDAAKPVSGATGSIDSFCPVTFKVQPSGVLKTPGGPEGTGPLGPPGGGGAESAAGTTGAGGGGSANASGAAPVGTSMPTAAKVAKRFNMSRWRLSSCESPRDRQDLSRGIFDGPDVQTVNGPTTVRAVYLSTGRLQSRHAPCSPCGPSYHTETPRCGVPASRHAVVCSWSSTVGGSFTIGSAALSILCFDLAVRPRRLTTACVGRTMAWSACSGSAAGDGKTSRCRSGPAVSGLTHSEEP